MSQHCSKDFFDNDPMDIDSVNIVAFNKNTYGMKSEMDQTKVKNIYDELDWKNQHAFKNR